MRNRTIALGMLSVAALGLTACSGSGGGSDSGGDKGEITIAVFAGWGESIVSSALWKSVLEDQGYAVTLQEADVAPVFAGVSTGDYDFTTQVSMPVVHKSYMDEYGSELEDLGSWYEESIITVAVNEDAPIDSLDELADNADEFANTIVGIEPGAGQTMLMEEEVIPGYGLDDMSFTASSTAAMLSELESATNAGENVVVSLWEPHWAYAEFPIKNLDDPKGLLGEPDQLHTMARTGFSEDNPEVAAWLEAFTMDKETLLSLEQALLVDADADDEAALDAWIAENQEYVDSLTS